MVTPLVADVAVVVPTHHSTTTNPYRKSSFSLGHFLTSPSRYAILAIGFLFCFYVLIFVTQLLPSANNGYTGNGGAMLSVPLPASERKAKAIFEASKKAFLAAQHSKADSHKSAMNHASGQTKRSNPFLTNGATIKESNTNTDKIIYDPIPYNKDITSRPGVIVLGMHRSGTSMLSGLLVTGMKYRTGGPLIGAHFDNEKGFFERVDVVLQNDEFMGKQKIGWDYNVIAYDAEKALADKDSGRITFKEGKKGLAFLNDPSKSPWLQKDPRMCITLRTWLPLITSGEPAILFTYRHPLEVAKSLVKRQMGVYSIEHGLRLWIVYNMRAIQNSAGLCRVLSSNELTYANPLQEVKRMARELHERCKVALPEGMITQKDVDKFVDPNLVHNKKDEGEGKQVLQRFGDCVVYDYDTESEKEKDLYAKAMKIYCDFKSGIAFDSDYEWPSLR